MLAYYGQLWRPRMIVAIANDETGIKYILARRDGMSSAGTDTTQEHHTEPHELMLLIYKITVTF